MDILLLLVSYNMRCLCIRADARHTAAKAKQRTIEASIDQRSVQRQALGSPSFLKPMDGTRPDEAGRRRNVTNGIIESDDTYIQNVVLIAAFIVHVDIHRREHLTRT